jgi:hypothetical protein
VVTDTGLPDGLPYFEDLETTNLHITAYSESGTPVQVGLDVKTSPTTINIGVTGGGDQTQLVLSVLAVGRAYAS